MTYTPLELATAFIKTGELADALHALNRHLDAMPDDDAARRLRVETLLRLPDSANLHAALLDLDALQTPTADDLVRRSVIDERLGESADALQAMDDALAQQPGAERLVERQLYLLQKYGDFETALQIVETMPRTWRWRQWAGDLAKAAGRWDKAAAAYTDALLLLGAQTDFAAHEWARPVQARLLAARAEVYRQQDQLDDAEADYSAAAALIPDDSMIAFSRGMLAVLRGDEAAGVEMCRQAYTSAPETLREAMRDAVKSDVRYNERLF